MLNNLCESLPGVGPALGKKLAKCGVQTVQDLLFHLPYRYQDRTRITPIQDLRPNEWSVVAGKVMNVEVLYGKRKMLICYLNDKTGILKLRFFHFNQNQVASIKNAEKIMVFGEVKVFKNQFEMIHPEYQLKKEDSEFYVNETLTPIYPTTQGLTQSRLRQLVDIAYKHVKPVLEDLEWLPTSYLEQYNLEAINKAIYFLHNPSPDTELKTLEDGTHPSLKRLIFDELIAKQLSMQFAKKKRQQLKAPKMMQKSTLIQKLVSSLPFTLTNAQKRVTEEVVAALREDKPMLRLVQGDVGAGKTVIAALSALHAIDNGYQVAFMAPTDLLSEQHYNNLEVWFENLDVQMKRLTGKMKKSEQKTVYQSLEDGTIKIVVGTHALFQDKVKFNNLGLIIIDEQHRFGVEQRLKLQQKGNSRKMLPHQLLMTATPIPRTLAMAQFTHLSLSVLDELPPGRIPITTAVINQNRRNDIITRLKSTIAAKAQVYWVCTLIEESEKLQCQAAEKTREDLQNLLPEAKIGLVHGRMKAEEKENIMLNFKNHEIDLLVATTVIEVGVDVKNASLMIIENAERLGLSQLHQLRGRVGRGNNKAYCVLLYQSPLSAQGRERLQIMRETTDGFIIAEKDLALRGAGALLGKQQTGFETYKIANLQRDKKWLDVSLKKAQELISLDANLGLEIAKRWCTNFEEFFQVG